MHRNQPEDVLNLYLRHFIRDIILSLFSTVIGFMYLPISDDSYISVSISHKT